MTEAREESAFGARLVRASIRALWHWVLPALLALVAFRHLFPRAGDPFDPASGELLGRLAGELGPAVVAVFFVVFALGARYLAELVPGARADVPVVERPSTSRRTASFALSIAAVALLSIGLRSSVAQSYRVLSSSMLPGLVPGAYLYVNKLAYGFHLPGTQRKNPRPPLRGDVVVFRRPEGPEQGEELVKRVVGLPGDRVAVTRGRVFVNGWSVPACLAGRYPVVGASGAWVARLHVEFLDGRAYAVVVPMMSQNAETFGEYVVRPGEVFVLGDNRAMSVDSRAWNEGRGGGVSLPSISGRVDRLLFDVDRNGHIDVARVLEPLALELHLTGIEARALEENVRGCLKLQPKDTSPPKPGATQAKK